MALTPYEEIRAKYCLHSGPDDMSWEELVGWHLANPLAYVIKEPDFFVMCRGVVHAAPIETIRNLTSLFPVEQCDAWYIYAFAGDLGKVASVLSDKFHAYPWIGWERFEHEGNTLNWHQCNRIRKQLT